MKKVLLIIVLYALFPTWGMSESLKIDVYRAKNLENKLNYRDSERAFKCLANGINLTTTSRFLNVMTELYGDSITNSFYNEKKYVRIHILINNSTRECILTIRPINKDSDLCFYNFITTKEVYSSSKALKLYYTEHSQHLSLFLLAENSLYQG